MELRIKPRKLNWIEHTLVSWRPEGDIAKASLPKITLNGPSKKYLPANSRGGSEYARQEWRGVATMAQNCLR